MITILIILLIIHWAADYTHLSRPYMLAAKKTGSPLMPILHHSFIHAGFMMSAIIIYQHVTNTFTIDIILLCFIIELITHFFIDVLKGKLNVWFPSLANPANPFHWYVFGLDQLLHFLVIILISFLTVNCTLLIAH
jgi:hypothetical protein